MRTILLSLIIAVACALAACDLCLAGGDVCTHQCSRTADCPTGTVCVHEHAHDLNIDTCEAPCTYNDAGAPSFTCPDSPLGTACRNDDGTAFCPMKF